MLVAVVVGFAEEGYNVTEGAPSASQMVCVTILEGELQSENITLSLTVSATDGTAQSENLSVMKKLRLSLCFLLANYV